MHGAALSLGSPVTCVRVVLFVGVVVLCSVEINVAVVFMLVLDIIGDLCFFAEMFLQLRTGYYDDGVIVWDRQKIWQRYLHSGWFALDLVTCLPFDLIQIGFLRIIPAVRAPKTLRFFQVLHHYNNIEENTTVSLQFRLLKLLFFTGILGHFGGCLKYIVMLQDPPGTELRDSLDAREQFGKYLQTMYWSVGILTGRDDSGPVENIYDAAYTDIMFFLGILWVAYIIASLESFAHEGNRSSSRFQAKLAYVQQFMFQFQLPAEIQEKVKSYYNYVWNSTLRFDTEGFLATLPDTLRSDVQIQLHGVVQRAAIFQDVDPGFIAFIVHKISTIVTIPKETICQAGMVGDALFFVAEGEVEILVGPKLNNIATLRAGDSFGDYGIFLSDTRTATARSVSYCTLLVLSASDLIKALTLFPASDAAVRAHVEEHRARTAGQERNFLGLGGGGSNKDSKAVKAANTPISKLQKLLQQDKTVVAKVDEHWTLSPTSVAYQRWQMAYFFVMLWLAIMLPFQFGFMATYEHPAVLVIGYVCDAFLLVDLALGFRVRYVHGGAEVTDPVMIRNNYLRTWFVPHVLASIPLDFLMIASGFHAFYRLNRAIRLVHVHTVVLARLKEVTHNELMSLLYLLFNFLWLSHCSASLYFSLTRSEGFQPDLENGHPDFLGWRPTSAVEHGSLLYKYLQSHFYSISLLAGIGRHVYPPTDLDAFLSLFNILTGLFVVSYLIGKVGPLIIRLNASAAGFKAEVDFVTHLLDYRKVTPEVAARVTEYMRHIWTSQKGIDPNVALTGLPSQLRTEIMLHICEEVTQHHTAQTIAPGAFGYAPITLLTIVFLFLFFFRHRCVESDDSQGASLQGFGRFVRSSTGV